MLMSKVNLILVHNFLKGHNFTDFLKYISKNFKFFRKIYFYEGTFKMSRGHQSTSERQVA